MADQDLARVPMTEEHTQRLRKYTATIVDELEHVEKVIGYMIENRSLRKDPGQEALAKATPRMKARCLLDYLPRHSELAFKDFVNALEVTQMTPDLYLLLRDETEGELKPIQPFLFGKAKEYACRLKAFHMQKIDKVARARPVGQDVKLYVKLRIHEHHVRVLEQRRGFLEHQMLALTTSGTPIERNMLFTPIETDERSPKVVLLVGPPGSGKTATAYDLLHNHCLGNLWSNEYFFMIFILMRDISLFDPDIKMTLKELIFSCYSPSTSDKESVWQFMESHQDNILFLLEGFDEYKPGSSPPLTSPDYAATPSVLIDNLVKKSLLPGAHILITGRVHCIKHLEQEVDRVVELDNLNKEELEELLKKRLPSGLAKSLLAFILRNNSVASLCSIPVNAIGLTDYVKWRSKDKQTLPDLPETRASLLLLLAINLLHCHGVKLKDQPDLTAVDITSMKGVTMKKLCKMAYNGLTDKNGPKQIFDEKDLARHDLTVEEVTESGLMTAHITSVADIYRPVQKILLTFLHYTFQEELSTIHVLHEDPEHLVNLVAANTGTHDMTTLLGLGLCADLTCRPLLETLYPETNVDAYIKLIPRLLEAAWGCPRRYYNDGELWCIAALGESLRYDLSGELCTKMATHLKSLQMWGSLVTSANCNSVVAFLDSVPQCERFGEVRIQNNVDGRDLARLLGTQGFTGITTGIFQTKLKTDLASNGSTDVMSTVSQIINTSTTLKQVRLVGQPDAMSVWDKFKVTSISSIERIGFQGGAFQAQLPQTVCSSLANCHALQALILGSSNLSCRDNVSPLHSLLPLTSIRHLRLQKCNLCASCMPTVVELMLKLALLWLEISFNPIGDEGAVMLADGLSHSQCILISLIIEECDIQSEGMDILCEGVKSQRSLKCLKAEGNDLSGCSKLQILMTSSLTQLSLAYCKLSGETLCTILYSLSNETSPITWLELTGNSLNSLKVVSTIDNISSFNHSLKALCLGICDLTDDILKRLVRPSYKNHSLELLDIHGNESLTSKSIVELIHDTHIHHLGLKNLDMGKEGWRDIAIAMLSNKQLMTCWVGCKGKESDLHGFLNTIGSYPPNGPLRTLMVNGDRAALAGQASKLRQTLSEQVSLGFDTYGLALYTLSDLYFKDFPIDLAAWLTNASVVSK